jgi:hypothetical protein
VYVAKGAGSHLERNTIAFNAKAGITIVDPAPAAFNAVIANAVFGNVGPGVDLRDDGPSAFDAAMQNPPEITSAIYDPVKHSTLVTGSFIRAAVTPFFGNWFPTIDFFASPYPEFNRRGSGQLRSPGYPFGYIESAKDEGGGRYTFTTTLGAIDLQGMRLAATATPFSYQGFKAGPPQGTLFGEGFVYGTTSEMSKPIPVATLGCPSEMPLLATPALDGPISPGPVTVGWSTVAGGTSYNVWLRRPGDVPRIAVNTAGAIATVTLPPGRTEWFVEALFPACPSTKSDAGVLDVATHRHRAAR